MNQTLQTPSVNFSNECKLVNFNVPNYLINQFDDLVKFKRKSRTSILLTLIETYLRDERTQIQKDNELSESFKSIKKKYESPKPKKVVKEEPMIPYSNDDIDWEDRLNNL